MLRRVPKSKRGVLPRKILNLVALGYGSVTTVESPFAMNGRRLETALKMRQVGMNQSTPSESSMRSPAPMGTSFALRCVRLSARFHVGGRMEAFEI